MVRKPKSTATLRAVLLRDARRNLDQLVDDVCSEAQRIVLVRHGKRVAGLVSAADLEALEAIEERLDLLDARDALDDDRVSGGVRWEDVKRDVGQ